MPTSPNEKTPTQRHKDHKKLGKHDRTKETNKAPISDLKEMENYELSDKVFRIILLKKFSELKENTDKTTE